MAEGLTPEQIGQWRDYLDEPMRGFNKGGRTVRLPVTERTLSGTRVLAERAAARGAMRQAVGEMPVPELAEAPADPGQEALDAE